MRLERFYTLFPVPKILELSAVGIDISDESIKYAELSRDGSRYRLSRWGSAPLEPGTIISGKIVDKAKLSAALRAIKEKNGFRYVYAALPEEECFVTHMAVPNVAKRELRSSIELQIEEYIPVPANQVVFDYEIYAEPKGPEGEYAVGVYSAPKALVADYTEAIAMSGLEPVALEIEVQSTARAIAEPRDPSTSLVVDIGKTRTSFSIVSAGVVLMASTINTIGGENLTKAIQKALNVTPEEAEAAKIKRGLLYTPTNKEVFEALIPIVATFKDEISRHYTYWQNLWEKGSVGSGIGKILFCGGQATLPGLTSYISSNARVPVEVGNPWKAFWDIEQEIPPIDFNNSLRYSTAFGLALRGANLHLL